MNHEEATRIAKTWCDAWNRKNLEAILEHYADDVAFSSPTVISRLGVASGWIYGKEKLREHFATGLQVPNLHFEFQDVLLGVGGMCVLYRRETGALVDVVELNSDGKGQRVHAYYGQQPSKPQSD